MISFKCKKCNSDDLCLDCNYDEQSHLIPPIMLSCRNCLRYEEMEIIPKKDFEI